MAVPPETRSDAEIAAALLESAEQVLRITHAQPTMRRAGIVAVGYAVPVFALAWFPLRKVATHVDGFTVRAGDGWPALLFGGFGLLWLLVGLRLLWEPGRLHRLYPHVFHLLTDRRFLAIDRRSGPLHAMAFADIRQMKIFAPFGRLTFWRRGLVSDTGRRARVRDFDGVADVEAVARRVSELTGVPVGMGGAAQPRPAPSP